MTTVWPLEETSSATDIEMMMAQQEELKEMRKNQTY